MPPVKVPLIIQSTPMALTVSGDTDAHGDTIGHILVSMPMATFLIAMNEEGGHALIRDLEKIFGRPPGNAAGGVGDAGRTERSRATVTIALHELEEGVWIVPELVSSVRVDWWSSTSDVNVVWIQLVGGNELRLRSRQGVDPYDRAAEVVAWVDARRTEPLKVVQS